MKVKAIKDYYDKQLKRDVKTGEEIDADKARAEVLVSAGVGEVVAETETKKPRKKAVADE